MALMTCTPHQAGISIARLLVCDVSREEAVGGQERQPAARRSRLAVLKGLSPNHLHLAGSSQDSAFTNLTLKFLSVTDTHTHTAPSPVANISPYCGFGASDKEDCSIGYTVISSLSQSR